jgi:predicted permease
MRDLDDRRDRIGRLRDWLGEIRNDVAYAGRQLARERGFTITAALMLALGIGANAAMFSVVYRRLIAPLPFVDGNRIVYLRHTSNAGNFLIDPGVELTAAWRARTRTVQQTIAYTTTQSIIGDSTRGATETIESAAVTPAAFSFLGMSPVFGRSLVAADTAADAPPVVVIGEAFWRRTYGGSRDALGTRLLIDGQAHTVVGVMPEEFFIPSTDARDLFVALRGSQTSRSVSVMGRLKPGSTIRDANRELAAMFPPKSALNSSDDVPHLEREVDSVGSGQRTMVLLLFGAVGVVLLIACANVANLFLARAWMRQREFAVRLALGAGRWRIVRQVFTESLILALAAGALGVAVLFAVLEGIRIAFASTMRGFADIPVGPTVYLWAAGLSILTGILFGMAPAMSAASGNVGEALKAGARTSAGSRAGRRFRSALVVVEVALSVVLLAGAGLLVRTLISLNRVDVGFDPRGLYGIRLSLKEAQFKDLERRRAVVEAAEARVRAVPGVRAVTQSWSLPPDLGYAPGTIEIEGRPRNAADSVRTSRFSGVSPDYFTTVGMRLVRGRTFEPFVGATDRTGIEEVIVNESFARANWPDGNAVGARIRAVTGAPWVTIIGVVPDVRLPASHERTRAIQLYERGATAPTRVTFIVRSDLAVAVLGPAIESAIHESRPAIKLGPLQSSTAGIASSMATQRSVLALLGAFAVLAVLLAAIGLHGVIAYSVSQRTREIGVRIALGAQTDDVMGLVLRQGFALAIAGLAIGVAGSLTATRVLETLLYGVQPQDPVTLGAVGALLFAIAVVASYAPARRAARVDPIDALRAD